MQPLPRHMNEKEWTYLDVKDIGKPLLFLWTTGTLLGWIILTLISILTYDSQYNLLKEVGLFPLLLLISFIGGMIIAAVFVIQYSLLRQHSYKLLNASLFEKAFAAKVSEVLLRDGIKFKILCERPYAIRLPSLKVTIEEGDYATSRRVIEIIPDFKIRATSQNSEYARNKVDQVITELYEMFLIGPPFEYSRSAPSMEYSSEQNDKIVV